MLYFLRLSSVQMMPILNTDLTLYLSIIVNYCDTVIFISTVLPILVVLSYFDVHTLVQKHVFGRFNSY